MAEQQLVLGYWAIRGRAQSIRFILEYLKVPYVDQQYTSQNEWFQVDKPKLIAEGLSFANLPFLTDGDFKMSECQAIPIYIARKYRPELLGKTPQDEGRMFMLISAFEDSMNPIISLLYSKDYENQRTKVYDEKVSDKLTKLHNDLGDKQFFIEYLTILDFRIYEQLQYVKGIWPEKWSNFPKFEEYFKRFEALDGISQYIASQKFQSLKNQFLPPTSNWTGFK